MRLWRGNVELYILFLFNSFLVQKIDKKTWLFGLNCLQLY